MEYEVCACAWVGHDGTLRPHIIIGPDVTRHGGLIVGSPRDKGDIVFHFGGGNEEVRQVQLFISGEWFCTRLWAVSVHRLLVYGGTSRVHLELDASKTSGVNTRRTQAEFGQECTNQSTRNLPCIWWSQVVPSYALTPSTMPDGHHMLEAVDIRSRSSINAIAALCVFT
jgi:hypothetical protein